MQASLPYQDFVPPSDVLGRTSRPIASYIAIASFCNTLLCRQVYLPWLKATLQELRSCSVVCLSWYSGHVGLFFNPHRISFAFEGRCLYCSDKEADSEWREIFVMRFPSLSNVLVGIAELLSAFASGPLRN
ncbi:hypothetical protein PoB_004826900 [Plakobranchus ocellatus]|uniref:Uncharacterized protein n=1 Tax=Plakobranchus ocellatus TaxID=259542 RepID=A0AAV4BTR8_9GAST|nr:hypothetical protein PoB_004826900 [Plakobranchus ocellatus]